MSDQDGDSQMRASSPSSPEAEADSTFPSANEQFHPHQVFLQKNAVQDLSPPHSQDRTQADGEEAMDMSKDPDPKAEVEDEGLPGNHEPVSVGRELRYEPGWRWKNPKAREEYQRASNQLLDRKFSLKQFGDPFDDRESTTSASK